MNWLRKIRDFIFTPTEPFTHHASFWGIPCYVVPEGEECLLAGTNIVYDWLILHVVPHCFFVTNWINAHLDPDFEPGGWPILVKGKIER